MKIHRLKKSKAMTSDMILGIVTAIICLFIGIFAINMTASINNESSLKDYSTYNTSTFTINTNISTTANLTKGVSILAVVGISGKTPITELKVGTENTNTTRAMLFTIYTNVTGDRDHVRGTVVLTPSTENYTTYEDIGWLGNTLYQVIVTTNGTSDGTFSKLPRVLNITVKYPTAKTNTGFGTIFDNLTSSTSTVYDVIFLVIIVVTLGIGLVVLRGLSGGSSATPI